MKEMKKEDDMWDVHVPLDVSLPYTGGTNRLEIIDFGLPCDETADE